MSSNSLICPLSLSYTWLYGYSALYGDGGSDHAPPPSISRSAVIAPRSVNAEAAPLMPSILPTTPSICATPIFCVKFALSRTLDR